MLIGRDLEVAQARRLLDAGTGCVVTGEAGMGTTAVVAAALADRGVRSGQCLRSLGWTAGSPLEQAVGSPLPAGDVSWTARWLLGTFRRRVLRIEDVQWADSRTLDVLTQLIGAVPLALSLRLGDPGSQHALAKLVAGGLPVVALGGLPVDVAADLARRRHPRLRDGEARSVAERCGCNPLLIEQLGADGSAATGLRRSVLARLRRLTPAARADFTALALAGVPLPVSWLPALAVLDEAGLTTVADDLARARHPLVADVVVAELAETTPDVVRQHHLDLADRAEAGGATVLAARSLHAAGERARALPLALTALDSADTPGDRATLLHLAAVCADGEHAYRLANQAVEVLVSAGEHLRAAELVAQLPASADPHRLGLVGRIRWQTGDDDGAIAAFEAGLAVADEHGADHVLLQAECARALVLSGRDIERALRLATDAAATAGRVGVEHARTLAVLGTVEYFAGDISRARCHLGDALTLAADGAEDVQVEFTTANNLISVNESTGDAVAACRLAERYAARAAALHLGSWHEQMVAMGLNARLHLGDYDRVLAGIPPLLDGLLDPRTRDQLEVTLGVALVDLGRCDDVGRRVRAALTVCADDFLGRANLLWVLSESQLWAADPAAALMTARASFAAMPDGDLRFFPLLTIAHARLRLGEPVDDSDLETQLPMLAGAPLELAAAAALSAGDLAGAASRFAEAATAWSGQHRRGELRCRWLAADCALDGAGGRPGSAAAARAELLALDAELDAAGWAPLLGQVRRSLRAGGVRRGAVRGRAGVLTSREREVLDLVAAGLSTTEIAARLCLSPATVAAQVTSARSRLGAHTRWQAAGSG